MSEAATPETAAEPTETSTPAVTSTVEDAGPCLKKLCITVPAAMVKDEMNRAFLDVIRNLRVPGFRAGHLPRAVAEARFGDAVRHEVRNNLLEKSFQDALEQHSLTPLSNPDLESGDAELEADKDFAFELTLEVKPEITLPGLSDIVLEREAITVSDEDIDGAIDSIRMDRAELRPVADGKLEEKDVAVINVAVLVEGERVLDAENLQYRHPSDVIAGIGAKGISEEMLGSKPGDEKKVAVTLPANFKLPEHSGVKAELLVAVQEIKRFHLPEVDEEFAKSLDFDDVAELREEAKKAVQRNKEEQEEKRLDRALLDAVIDKAPIELPAGIVKKEIGQVLARYQAELHMQGASAEVIEERLAEMQVDAVEHVEREFRVAFLVEEYAKENSIFVTENDVAEQVTQMSGQYGKTPDEMREHLLSQNLVPSLRGRLRERKVLADMRNAVTIK